MLTCCFVSKAYVTGWYSGSVHLDNGKTLIQQLLQECQDHQHGALKRPEIHLPSFAECIEGALGLWLVAVVLCRSMVMARFSLSPPASASGGRCSSAWQAGSSNEALRSPQTWLQACGLFLSVWTGRFHLGCHHGGLLLLKTIFPDIETLGPRFAFRPRWIPEVFYERYLQGAFVSLFFVCLLDPLFDNSTQGTVQMQDI